MTKHKGTVSRVDPVLKIKTPILDLTNSVYYYAEAGPLGMAMHPDFLDCKRSVFSLHLQHKCAGIV